MYYKRLLSPPNYSFFLFGPRGVGKSTWLDKNLKKSIFIDLLSSDLYFELSQNPSQLENIIGENKEKKIICIDEVQKIPQLLNEVHRLMQKKEFRFALSGSSARKLRTGGANLLAGRAITSFMGPLCFGELLDDYQTGFQIEFGSLPLVIENKAQAKDILSAYISSYLEHEIRAEGLIRKTEPFIRFLQISALMSGQVVNFENIATEAKVPASSVKNYFSILEDTLIGSWLPAYQPRAKVREYSKPKFYWFDPGVVRAASGRAYQAIAEDFKGLLLETLVLHEIKMYNHYFGKHKKIYYYNYSNGEIDFIIEINASLQDAKPEVICIEVKFSDKWKRKWEKPIRSLEKSGKVRVLKKIGLYRGNRSYDFDGFQVMPVENFFTALYQGKIY